MLQKTLRSRHLFIALVSISLSGGYAYAIGGQTVIPLKVLDAQGQKRSTQAFKGKKNLLLTFFPRCFTSRCEVHLGSLRDSYTELQKADIEVWAVSVDPAEGEKGQRAFAEWLKLPFPLIPDVDRKICLQFGAVQNREQMAKRMSVFIDKKGVVRWIDYQIDPAHHGADVLKRYKAEIEAEDAKPQSKEETPAAR